MSFRNIDRNGNFNNVKITTYSDSGDTTAGLLNTDMSRVDLISFFGCETFLEIYNDQPVGNLGHAALKEGANTTIGFTDSIYTHFQNGQEGVLLTEYNDSINMGTYNYAGPDDVTKHALLDVLPWADSDTVLYGVLGSGWKNVRNQPDFILGSQVAKAKEEKSPAFRYNEFIKNKLNMR